MSNGAQPPFTGFTGLQLDDNSAKLQFVRLVSAPATSHVIRLDRPVCAIVALHGGVRRIQASSDPITSASSIAGLRRGSMSFGKGRGALLTFV